MGFFSNGDGWTPSDIPDQSGKMALITGANSGIGFEATRLLTDRGMAVILACRSQQKAESAIARLRQLNPSARLSFRPLDLASLDSIRACAESVVADNIKLDLLINNAGVMALPRCETADGFEMQLGTNHLGHFALTGQLLPALLNTAGSRIVSVASQAHRMGHMNFDDLHHKKSYEKWSVYGQSKLANLLFIYELQRKLSQAKAQTIALACHPGYASTHLQLAGPEQSGSTVSAAFWAGLNGIVAQSAERGACPTVRAATDPSAVGANYFGPAGLGEWWGAPVRVQSNARSRSLDDAARLWTLSEQATGVSFSFGDGTLGRS